MAQVTETVARGILAGHGYTDNEVRQLAHHWLATHGQAPADAKALAEADRRAGEAERLLATCKEDVMRFEQVRSRMKYQWGAEQRVSFDEVWDEALALKKAAQAAPQAADSVTAPAPPPECETEAEKRAFAFGWFKALESERMKADSVQEDAALWHWLAEYLVGPRTDLDDEIVASETVNDLRKLVKAAIKQGATQ